MSTRRTLYPDEIAGCSLAVCRWVDSNIDVIEPEPPADLAVAAAAICHGVLMTDVQIAEVMAERWRGENV